MNILCNRIDCKLIGYNGVYIIYNILDIDCSRIKKVRCIKFYYRHFLNWSYIIYYSSLLIATPNDGFNFYQKIWWNYLCKTVSKNLLPLFQPCNTKKKIKIIWVTMQNFQIDILLCYITDKSQSTILPIKDRLKALIVKLENWLIKTYYKNITDDFAKIFFIFLFYVQYCITICHYQAQYLNLVW